MNITAKPHESLVPSTRMIFVDHRYVGMIQAFGNDWKFCWNHKASRGYTGEQRMEILEGVQLQIELMKLRVRMRA